MSAKNKLKKSDYDYGRIQNMIDYLIDLNVTARTQGLLALEEKISDLVREKTGERADTYDAFFYRGLSGADRILAILVMLVVDGTAPELIAEIAEKRCACAELEGTDALLAEMAVTGVRAIQAGQNPTAMKLLLFSMLPEELENRAIENEIAKREQEKPGERDDRKDPVRLSDEEVSVLLASAGENSDGND